MFCGRPLIEYAISNAKKSRYMSRIIVSTDNEETKNVALGLGAEVPFVRPAFLSDENVGIEPVLQYTLRELEKNDHRPDLVVYLSIYQPFRSDHLIDGLIGHMFANGFDSVLAGYPTYKPCWIRRDDGIVRVDDGFMPSKMKQPLHMGCAGLACVTSSECIKSGRLLGDKVGIYEILDFYSTIDVKNPSNRQLAEIVYPYWKGEIQGADYEKRDETVICNIDSENRFLSDCEGRLARQCSHSR
jgi:CMP-N-acetylneuraminic acid synthetase